MTPPMTYTDLDREIWLDELDEFVPMEIFDAHNHIYDFRRLAATSPKEQLVFFGEECQQNPLSDWDTLAAVDATLFPGRRVHRIAMGMPVCPEWMSETNEFVAKEIRHDAESIALMLVSPDMSADVIRETAKRCGFKGLKPYRFFSATGDVVDCRITDFLPHHQLRVADELHMMITLHISRCGALGDAFNIADIEDLTQRYPNIRWNLAHCGRSYYARPIERSADRLRRMPQLYYDISSICDSDAIGTLLDIAGPHRMMYGSDDLPVGISRGKYITFAHGWSYLSDNNHQMSLSHCDGRMTLVRYESLRALRNACRRLKFTAADIRAIFYDNAKRLATGPSMP